MEGEKPVQSAVPKRRYPRSLSTRGCTRCYAMSVLRTLYRWIIAKPTSNPPYARANREAEHVRFSRTPHVAHPPNPANFKRRTTLAVLFPFPLKEAACVRSPPRLFDGKLTYLSDSNSSSRSLHRAQTQVRRGRRSSPSTWAHRRTTYVHSIAMHPRSPPGLRLLLFFFLSILHLWSLHFSLACNPAICSVSTPAFRLPAGQLSVPRSRL